MCRVVAASRHTEPVEVPVVDDTGGYTSSLFAQLTGSEPSSHTCTQTTEGTYEYIEGR